MRLLASVLVCFSLSACWFTQHPPEAKEALASLRKIRAATEVGITYQKYGELLIDAKDRINAASRVLSDGPVKTALNDTMQSYSDAALAWGKKIRSEPLREANPIDRQIIQRYSLPVINEWGYDVADPDAAIKTIWHRADIRLADAERLLE